MPPHPVDDAAANVEILTILLTLSALVMTILTGDLLWVVIGVGAGVLGYAFLKQVVWSSATIPRLTFIGLVVAAPDPLLAGKLAIERNVSIASLVGGVGISLILGVLILTKLKEEPKPRAAARG